MSFRMSSLGRMAASRFAAGSSAFSGSVILLCNMDGVNNGTVFTDEALNRTVTVSSAFTNTSVKKFGTASMACSGFIGNRISYPETSATNIPADFTAEGWAYTSGTAYFQYLFRLNASAVWQNGQLSFGASNTGKFNLHLGGAYPAANYYEGTANCPVNTWFHWCVERFNGVVKTFFNGALDITSPSFTLPIYSASGSVTHVGMGGTGVSANYYWGSAATGYIDSLRISTGARHQGADFVVPDSAYSLTNF